jgi:beta-mannosidase
MLITMLGGISVHAASRAEYEIKNFLKPGPSPMDAKPVVVTLSKTSAAIPPAAEVLSLDGEWEFNFDIKLEDVLGGKQKDYFKATVPGSITTALHQAGVIGDPYAALNDKEALAHARKTMFFKKTFPWSGQVGERLRLRFDGVADSCTIFLNGGEIGSHQGMFGGPYLDITGKLKEGENTLVVMLKPCADWLDTVVFNCVYGWHYALMPPIGIWRPVSIERVPLVELDSPFITTVSHETRTMDFATGLINHAKAAISGKLILSIRPANFEGQAYSLEYPVTAEPGTSQLRLRFDLPDGRLWYPNTLGEQNLYTLGTAFVADGTTATKTSEFGIRSLRLDPFPGGENDANYNRTTVINGRPVFMKGAGWCTIDAMMRFGREDYDRILKRAHEQGVNFLRAWGGGMPETEEFYALCNQYGICVYQEWPVCWDSTKRQPADVLYETVVLNTKRIRNNPSLILYGGGNEGQAPFTDEVLNTMGRLTYEHDGTRTFYRQDGAGAGNGIAHDHIHWSGQSPEHYATHYANSKGVNLTEYGLDSMMNLESIAKYATPSEIAAFPIDPKGTIAYHTSTFNGMLRWKPSPHGFDIDAFMYRARDFLEVKSVADLVTGTQLAQTMAKVLAAQNARTQFPDTTAIAYYKLNDVYPGASWAVVDFYGVPKIAHWFLQDANTALTAVGRFDRYNTHDKADKSLNLPIYLLDDAGELTGTSDYMVKVSAFDGFFKIIKEEQFAGRGPIDMVKPLGTFTLSAAQTDAAPMFIVIDLNVGGELRTRNYTFMNFTKEQGSLFTLPRTTLAMTSEGKTHTITNTGNHPAVAVNFLCPKVSDRITLSDNYFWLAPGESKTVTASLDEGIEGVTCFNAADTGDTVPPTVPAHLTGTSGKHDEIALKWDAASDDRGLLGYRIEQDGSPAAYVSAKNTAFTMRRLREQTEYAFTVTALDNNMNGSAKSQTVRVKTAADREPPALLNAAITADHVITAAFTKNLDPKSAANPASYQVTGVNVIAAVPGTDGRTVTLTTDGVLAQGAHTLTAAGVRDASASGNICVSAPFLMDNSRRGEFPFDEGEGTTTADRSGTFAEAAAIKNCEWVEGQHGKALKFGPASSVSLGKTDFVCNDATITMWLKRETQAGLNVLFAKNGKVPGHFEIYARDGALMFFAPETGDINLNLNLANYQDDWHHFAFIFHDGKLTIYVDGENVSEISDLGTMPAVDGVMAVGSLADGSLSFLGSIDDFRLYARVLPESEIKTIINTQP